MKTSSKLMIGVCAIVVALVVGLILSSRFVLISDNWRSDGTVGRALDATAAIAWSGSAGNNPAAIF